MGGAGATLAAMRRPEELYDLLDPDVMWYSDDVDSNRMPALPLPRLLDRRDAGLCVAGGRVTLRRHHGNGERPVIRSMHIRRTSSLTRHDLPVSLVGNGEGGGVPACSRVYMNRRGR